MKAKLPGFTAGILLFSGMMAGAVLVTNITVVNLIYPNGATDHVWQLQASTNLADTNGWTSLPPVYQGTPSSNTVVTIYTTNGIGFYRMKGT